MKRSDSLWYAVALAGSLVVVCSLQKFIEIRQVIRVPGLFEFDNVGQTKRTLGVLVSLLFLVLLTEFGWGQIGRRVVKFRSLRFDCSSRCYRFAFFLAAGVLLFGNLQSQLLAGYMQAVPTSPPAWVAFAWLAVWLAFTLASLWLPSTWRIEVAGFVGLILLTRIYAYSQLPFGNINGDMLSNIDRCLNLLLQGEFPYIDEPKPAMPYWPATLLLYLPAMLAGWDLRAMNLVIEIATVAIALGGKKDNDPRRAALRMVLPLIMLFPSWTFYSAEAHYPISSLFAVLFCRSLTGASGMAQAATLGIAVAVNQTFGLFGLFVLPYWIRQFGRRDALRFTLVSLVTCLVFISPFVIWNAPEFFRVTLLSLEPFTDNQLAGRFSLRPLVAGLFPRAPEVLLAVTIIGVMGLNGRRSKNANNVAAATCLGYCIVLLLLHRTFTHYYLPVIGMILSIPFENERVSEPTECLN